MTWAFFARLLAHVHTLLPHLNHMHKNEMREEATGKNRQAALAGTGKDLDFCDIDIPAAPKLLPLCLVSIFHLSIFRHCACAVCMHLAHGFLHVLLEDRLHLLYLPCCIILTI